MTTTADRQMELTLPMVPDIEIAAARAAGNLARELGMPSDQVDEMTHAIIEACINAREHSGSVDNRIYVRCLGVASSDGTLYGRSFGCSPRVVVEPITSTPETRSSARARRRIASISSSTSNARKACISGSCAGS